MTWTERKLVLRFALASIAIGYALQAMEAWGGASRGTRWHAIVMTGTATGLRMGLRGCGLQSVRQGAKTGMRVGAIDGLVRGATMYVTDRDVREHVSLPLTLYGNTGTNALLGALYGAVGAVLGLLLDTMRRPSRFER